MVEAGIYVRISEDKEGAGLGVGRQRQDCEALAQARGWRVAEVFSDNDMSAYRHKPRPEYQRMLAALHTGRLDGVVVWHLDRLYRQPRELEDMIDLCEHGRVKFAACHGDIDLATSNGRSMARIMVTMANQSSSDTSRRQVAKMAEVARNGRPHGGPRPYGFDHDRVTLIDSEAAAIRESVARLLRGESLRSVVRDLNEHGRVGTQGRPWQTTTFKRLLLRPRLAGRREHNGVESVATWPAIITDDQRVRLQALLNDPARRRPGGQVTHLLSGILRCGECGQRMVTHPAWGRNRRSYGCPAPPRGCNKVAVIADLADEWVTEAVLAIADDVRLALAEAEPDDDDPTEAIEAARAKMDNLALMLANDEIGADAFKSGQAALTARIDAEMRRLSARVEHERSRSLVGPGERLRDVWPEMSTEERRAELAVLLAHVTVTKGKGRTFSPERLTPVWH